MSTLPVAKTETKPLATVGSIQLDKIGADELEVIKKQFFPQNASIADMEYCFAVANNLGLNPLTKEIQFVGRRAKIKEGNMEKWVEKVEPMLGRDGYLAIAHRTDSFAGIETTSAIKEAPKLEANGEWSTVKTLVATSKVYKKGVERPFIVEVAYNEYVQTNSEGKPTKFWSSMPDTMLKKVAESQALRKAFNINGVTSAEETGVGTFDETGKLIIDAESQTVLPEGSLGKPSAPAVEVVAAEVVTPVEAADAELTGAGVAEEAAAAHTVEQPAEPAAAEQEAQTEQAMTVETVVDPVITPNQCEELNRKITEYGVDYQKFLDFMEVKHLADITQSTFGHANAALESKRRQNEAAAQKASQQQEAGQSSLFGATEQQSAPMDMNQVVNTLMAKNLNPQTDETNGVVIVKLAYGDGHNKDLLKSMGFKYDAPNKTWKWTK